MGKFVCKSCNYRFERDNVFECPYCGNEKLIEKEQSAEELLENINEILRD